VSQTVVLPPAIESAAVVEANRSYGGDLEACVAAAVDYYLGVQRTLHQVQDSVPFSPSDTDDQRLARAVAASGQISTTAMTSIADTIYRAMGLVPTYRNPDSVYEFVKRYLEWASKDNCGLNCVLVTSQPASGPDGEQHSAVVSYAVGPLRGDGSSVGGRFPQYFSDRKASPNDSAGFDPAQHDDLGVTVSADELLGLVTVELIGYSWGGARTTLSNLRIEDGILVGDGPSVGNQTASALYTINLGKVLVKPYKEQTKVAQDTDTVATANVTKPKLGFWARVKRWFGFGPKGRSGS